VHGKGFMLSTPDWVQGLHSYGWKNDSNSISYFRYANAQASLWEVSVPEGKSKRISLSPYHDSWLSDIVSSCHSDAVAFFASSPFDPKKIMIVQHEKAGVLYSSGNKLASADSPQHIEWKGADGESVYGILYLPSSNYEKPFPLLVDVHGGPTMQRTFSESPEAAFFVSYGYAFFQVNYRGSSGYGLPYQNALDGNWGVMEVEDVYSGVQHLMKSRMIDAAKIALMGSSSGGTTVLNVLRKYPHVFRCGICSYGIGDLIQDAENTHKFEKCYYRSLIGDMAKSRDAYLQRSPLFHVDEIQDPLLLFHGSEDPVVPPSQSQALFDSLVQRGIPCTLKIFEQEGHGFKRDETIKEYYSMIVEFLDCFL